jgi:crotonobetainyl-CoA:carnitine CoA-transferase CaiB-like acyl-CoA transferase
MKHLPLEGLIVLEFSQYLSGPSAGLRLADLGAQVIKIEKPGTGDAGRKLAIKNLWVDDNSLLFHTINRNKDCITADLKNAADLERIKKMIAGADVMFHNFRPGVMEKINLSYTDIQQINPAIIYGEISGYGKKGPWKNKPGQDLLLQAMTGLAYTTGNAGNDPMPFGIAVGDIMAGAQLVQGILAALIRRQKTKKGALIEISMMESLLDFQFELLTTYFTNQHQPKRSEVNNGHPLLSAPYGIYKTAGGYLALAMMDLKELAEAISCDALFPFGKEDLFSKRDAIKEILAVHLKTKSAACWVKKLQEKNLWAMEVLDWEKMMQEEAYKVLQMEQDINGGKDSFITTRCPIRINGQKIKAVKSAPQIADAVKLIKKAV